MVAQPGAEDPGERRVAEEMRETACVEQANEGEKMEGKKGYGGTKEEGMAWLRRCQDRIRGASSVLCVGGGALGIRAFPVPLNLNSHNMVADADWFAM